MRPVGVVALSVLFVLMGSACDGEAPEDDSFQRSSPSPGGGKGNGNGKSSGGSDGDALVGSGGSFAELCWSTINAYRERAGLPPYERWTDGESCADGQAKSDEATKSPHGAFTRCGEFAQNECPGTPGPPEKGIVQCLAMMWAEGPGGGHHDTMASRKYTKVACGLYVTPSGAIWSVQNFF